MQSERSKMGPLVMHCHPSSLHVKVIEAVLQFTEVRVFCICTLMFPERTMQIGYYRSLSNQSKSELLGE